jgi:RNA polymerase sigma-70 factor (ECF subfamily)
MAGPLPVERLVATETIARLTSAVATLSEADRHLIFACYFDGRSHADLAKELGVSPKTIETRLYRARRHLRAALREE